MPRCGSISDPPLQGTESLTVASSGTCSIIIDTRDLGALCQAEPQHQGTQQQSAQAARIKLHFRAATWGFLPYQLHLWLPELCKEQTVPWGDNSTAELPHPQIHWTLLAHHGAHGRAPVYAWDIWLSGPGPSFSKIPHKDLGQGWRRASWVLALCPATLSPPHPSPHLVQETSVYQVATFCCLVTQLLFE